MTNEDATPERQVPEEDPGTVPDGPGAGAPEPIEIRTQVEVGLVRSVRYGRIIVVFAALGAIAGAVAALFFPVAEDAEYELGQIVGFMLVVGAAIGLALGAILSLVLGLVAKRKHGAALATHADVG